MWHLINDLPEASTCTSTCMLMANKTILLMKSMVHSLAVMLFRTDQCPIYLGEQMLSPLSSDEATAG